MAHRPQLLLDEPLGDLENVSRKELMRELKTFLDRAPAAAIIATRHRDEPNSSAQK